MKHQSVLIFSIFVLLFFAANVFSQLPAPKTAPVLKDETIDTQNLELFQVGEVRGAVNTTAVFLAKPVFPLEARNAGAEGKVKVQITIDEDGNVIAANAVSGHSLLKATSEDAARRTKFRIARNAEGQAVKISGFLTYSFEIQKAGWTKIGYDLAMLEKIATLRYFAAPTVAKAFQPEWRSELALLEKIAEMKRAEIEAQPSAPVNNQPVIRQNTVRRSNGSAVSSMRAEIRGEMRLLIPNPPTAERISISQNLISSLQSRLGNDELSLWQFNLGIALSKALQLYRNPYERPAGAKILRQLAETAPSGISAEVKTELQNLASAFETKKRERETDIEIRKSLAIIFGNK